MDEEQKRASMHGEWSSKIAFVMAASGAAVGLGNIWKFPYIAGENGGGAFVLIYLGCVLLIGIPVMMAEILLGRRGRRNPADTFRALAEEEGHSKHWQWMGGLSILAGFLILSYYSVIAGWACDYVFHALAGEFKNADKAVVQGIFKSITDDSSTLMLWHSFIMLATTLVVAMGVEKGLEKSILFLFPSMLALLLVVVGYAITTGYFGKGLSFLFHPDFSKLSSNGALIALGHAFFTLSLATGSIMMYGAYVPKKISITEAAIYIAGADTFIALVAGMGIFPIVFAHGLQPAAGPGLIFQTLPLAFGNMPFGTEIATIFFIMLVFAAFTSAISLLEPSVAWTMERFKINRTNAACLAGSLIWFLGIGTVFSFNVWAKVKIFGLNIFDFLDYITANIMLPLGGLIVAIFTAWMMRKSSLLEELQVNENKLFKCWRFTLRYITPVAIFLVTLDFIGVI